MVASVGRITAGSGYDYLTRAVATDRHDYYTGAGEAAGVWAGSGRVELDLDGVVDADDMAALYGRFIDPRTAGNKRSDDRGRPLGEETVGEGLRTSPKVINQGTANERELHQVAAFDVTFSPSKSVSVLWGTTTSPDVQAAIVAAHEHAVATGIAYLEAKAGHARAGRNGVRRIDSSGFVIAQFRHRSARTTDAARVGDPQLHTHCAILNRLKCVDGKWRTLDGAAIYAHAHAAGAIYGAVLEQELSRVLGVAWVTPGERVMMREIDGMPDEVLTRFSTRRAQVLEYYDTLEAQWRSVHGRSPTRDERAGILDEATVRSRLGKVKGDGEGLHDQWRAQLAVEELHRIDNTVGRDLIADGGRLRAGSDAITAAVFTALHEQRAWWTRVHLFAEVARLIETPTAESVEREVERLVTHCIDLEPDHDHEYAQLDRTKFSSQTIIDAEQRVIAAANTPATWDVSVGSTGGLGDDQIEAVSSLCASPNRVTTVIGPAGSGKTTMLKAAAASYQQAGRPVVVLALSAAAARVVTEETGLPADTIAAWRVGQVRLPRGGLVIIDEASMVPTLALDELVRVADAYGCRVGLVGDYAQMGAPEAGGLLRDLSEQPGAVHMTAVRRFKAEWERDASTQLRRRDPEVADRYHEQGRITGVTDDQAIESVVAAWAADTAVGYESLIIVDTDAQAADVSSRCQQQRAIAGELGAQVGVAGRDGNNIRLGDLIQSRDNTRTLRTSNGSRVLNRDVWRVTGHADGGVIIAAHLRTGVVAELTADYTANWVHLAYAATVPGAQGRTTDAGHVLVTPRTSAASLYVGMTRGRHANHAHAVTNGHDHDEFQLGDLSARDAFAAAAVRTPDGQLSATSIRQRWNTAGGQRTQDRTEDRLTQQAASWWRNRHANLNSPRTQRRLDGRHHLVIAALTQRAPASWPQVVRAAIALTDWDQPDAGDSFVARLNNAPHTIGSATHAVTTGNIQQFGPTR